MDFVCAIIASLLSSLQGVVDAVPRFLWSWGAEGVGNLLNLEKNATALDREMEELKEARDDLKNKVQNLERQPGMRRTQQVSGWLRRVETLDNEVRSLQGSMEGRTTFLETCSFNSLHSGYLLGREVADLLKKVRELRGQRGGLDDTQLVDEAPPAPVVPVPNTSGQIVGAEKTLSEIRRHLWDEKVGIIGIYGMGGVGKTTLLQKINNQFIEKGNCDFDVVIWVTVSQKPNVYKIQEDIGVRLGFSHPGAAGDRLPLPEHEGHRRETLHRALNQRKFLLLLDDIWEKLALEDIGIPQQNIQSSEYKKIVFTTRSEEVCADMGVQQAKIKVGFLDWEDSWKLFKTKLDPRVNLDSNPDIQSLAEIVVRKCGGLPLALITMGRAMSNATWAGEWRQAVEKLRECPDKIRGLKDVLSLLRFSFDKLEDDVTRECLLYCALYPEDYDIWIEHLVEYWIGDGFLDDNSSNPGGLREAKDRGDCIIRKLKNACLLESSSTNEDTHVKLHDVVREMALWLTGEDLDRAKRFVVCSGEKGLAQFGEAKMWEDAERISITQGGTLQLPSLNSHCQSLSTILISHRFGRWNGLQIAQNFCEYLPALRVLDLSGTDVPELPGVIGLLAELRYLDLSRTKIRQLPKELGKLVKLRHLYLNFTEELSQIPREAMLTLTRLQALGFYQSAYRWADDDDDDLSGLKLSDVGCRFGRLEELSADIRTLSCLHILVNSETLRKCEIYVCLVEVADLTSPHLSAALDKLERLRRLRIQNCPTLEVWRVDYCKNQVGGLKGLFLKGLEQLKEIVAETEVFNIIQGGGGRGHGGPALLPPLFPSLLNLDIGSCHQLKDLRWIGRLPHLNLLCLWDCKGLEELLVGDGQSGGESDNDNDDDDHSPSFPKLEHMYLYSLPSLRSISMRPLLFPSLEELYVQGCPQLKRLPLGQRSCEKIKGIEGEQEWWDALEWDDYDPNGQSNSIKSTLAPFFQVPNYLPVFC